jgi:hypothetical protein
VLKCHLGRLRANVSGLFLLERPFNGGTII